MENQEVKRKKGEKTRQQILDQAIRLFSKHGFENTSFQMISDECGISQSIPLYHFKSKAGLFEAGVRHCQVELHRIIRESYDISDNAFDRLKKFCLGTFNWTNIYRSQSQMLLLLCYFASTHESFVSLYQEQVASERKEIEGFLLAGKREGLFHFVEPSDRLAELIQEAVSGLCSNFLGARSLIRVRDLDKKIHHFLETMVKYEHVGPKQTAG